MRTREPVIYPGEGFLWPKGPSFWLKSGSTDRRFKDAAGDIWQHMVNNNDWPYECLLQEHLDPGNGT